MEMRDDLIARSGTVSEHSMTRVFAVAAACIAGVVGFMWDTRSAYASCIPGSQSIESADSAFEALALPGPTAPDGALLSPVQFEVIEWIKGRGPSVVEVGTADSQDGEFFMHVGEGIAPEPGQRWLVMLRDGSAGCTGSRLLEAGEHAAPEPSSRSGFLAPSGVAGVVAIGLAAWIWRRNSEPTDERRSAASG